MSTVSSSKRVPGLQRILSHSATGLRWGGAAAAMVVVVTLLGCRVKETKWEKLKCRCPS